MPVSLTCLTNQGGEPLEKGRSDFCAVSSSTKTIKSGTPYLPPLHSTKVLDQLRERIRYRHYSIRIEEAYVYWVSGFIRVHRLRHPLSMGGPEVEEFLS